MPLNLCHAVGMVEAVDSLNPKLDSLRMLPYTLQYKVISAGDTNMDLDQATQQIDAIWNQVARSTTFRGYRARSVACTALLGFAAAAAQAVWLPDPVSQIDAYLWLWVAVAALSAFGVLIELALSFRRSPSRLERETTIRAVEQFAPCLLVGAAVTWAIGEVAVDSLWMLPGLWALLFSLGLFASARSVAPGIIYVGIYYAVAGIACLFWARGEHAFSPWAMAGAFGGGQLLTAAVLYWQLERSDAT